MNESPGGFHRFIHVCPSWLSGTLDTRLRRLAHDPEKILAGLIREGETAADIGSGPGYFTIGMARLAGARGRVFALDIQEKMIAKLRRRADLAGVGGIITTHLCGGSSLGLVERVDFALAFWMVHEVPDPLEFFRQVFNIVKPGGRFLFVEPKIHVTGGRFARTVSAAQEAGFIIESEPSVRLSRAVLFTRKI